MSTRFEKKIIMPNGTMGKTTLMDLSDEDIKSVGRWHKKEWNEFRNEIVAYKHKILDAARDMYLWNREHCMACKKFRSIKHQRGSIMMGAAGVTSSAHKLFDSDCTFTTSNISTLNDFAVEPSSVYTLARLHSDGDWYESEGSTGFGPTHGTWQGSCAVADYDTRWNTVSGDAPDYLVSGSNGTWSAATTSKAIGYSILTFADISSGSFNMECRSGATLDVLFTDSFTMYAELDPGC